MGKQGEPIGHWLKRTPLDGVYCNALLLIHRSVCQKLNHLNSVQFGSVTLLCGRLKILLTHYIPFFIFPPFFLFLIGLLFSQVMLKSPGML